MRAQPCIASSRDELVRVVAREHIGRAQAQLFQRVPDPVVRARLRKVIAARAALRALVADDRFK